MRSDDSAYWTGGAARARKSSKIGLKEDGETTYVPALPGFYRPQGEGLRVLRRAAGKPFAKRTDPSVALGGFIQQSHFTTFIILLVNFAIFAATLMLTSKFSEGSFSIFSGINGNVLVLFGAKERS